MNGINLIGHDSSTKYLKHIADNQYILVGDCVEYSRIILDDNGEIEYLDPPGGPMLHVGENINGKTISKITISADGAIFELI